MQKKTPQSFLKHCPVQFLSTTKYDKLQLSTENMFLEKTIEINGTDLQQQTIWEVMWGSILDSTTKMEKKKS